MIEIILIWSFSEFIHEDLGGMKEWRVFIKKEIKLFELGKVLHFDQCCFVQGNIQFLYLYNSK